MTLMADLPQTLGVAGLQLKLLSHKRFILVLGTLWIVNFVVDLQLNRVLASPQLLIPSLLIPSLLITDLLVVGMTCGLIADDAEHGTFPFVLSHAIDRRTWLVGKLLPVVALAFTFSVVADATTLALLRPQEPIGNAVTLTRFGAVSVMSLSRILVIAAATACLAVLLTNRYAAVIGALLYVYGLSYGLQSVFSPQSAGIWLWESLLPWRDGFERATVQVLSEGSDFRTVAAAVVQPLAYALIFGALAVRLLRRRDLVRGES